MSIKSVFLSLVLTAGIGLSPAFAQPDPPKLLVKIDSGTIEGTFDAARGVNEYLGVPYAAPPVGPLRWREPQPVTPHEGVLAANHLAPSCMQPILPGEAAFPPPADTRQSEDCLYLNVWAPAGPAKASRPVMVWFHGGGLMFGSGSQPLWQGGDLAKKGVVVVTVNYRLGPLGYLVLPQLDAESPHHVSGNDGLLDQIAALKWVHANIRAIGGDPNNVTIFGWSAGSTSVNALQATPLARGLFQKAIGHSTADMNPAAGIWHLRTVAEAEQYGRDYMRLLGAKTLQDMRALPARTLIDTPPKFWILENDGYVFPGEIHDIFASGRQTKVPLMAGATANEWTTLGTDMHWVNPKSPADVAELTRLYGPNFKSSGQLINDVVLWQMREWVRLNARAGVKNSYLWFFSEVPPAPPEPDGTRLGAYHGSELAFVFRTQHIFSWPWSAQEKKLQDVMSSYWVNFARTGNPNGPGLPRWPTYDGHTAMDLSVNPHPIPLPRAENLRFFTRFFARQRKSGGDNVE